MLHKTCSVVLAGMMLSGTALFGAAAGALPDDATAPSTPSLTSAQIVREMERRNQDRVEALKHYTAVRHYEVNYKGLGANLGAKMEVEVRFDATDGKTFRIVSQSGSKLLLDKVLKRLVDTEKEAASSQNASALTPGNYTFTLAGTESVNGRPAYVLSVEPLTQNKLLYRGKVWIDAADFALVKIDAEPAKNPSFWISKTRIQHTYARNGGFWLPEQNRSESKIRIGGAAVLTIDYGVYQFDVAARNTGTGN